MENKYLPVDPAMESDKPKPRSGPEFVNKICYQSMMFVFPRSKLRLLVLLLTVAGMALLLAAMVNNWLQVSAAGMSLEKLTWKVDISCAWPTFLTVAGISLEKLPFP